MDALIADFNKTYPNIEVTLNTYSNNSDGNLAVNTAIMGGEVDVLASFGLNNTYKRWENGLFLDLTDKCEADGIDLLEQWAFDCYKYGGRIYTFPCGGLSTYIAINMTAWNEAGLGELPTEWTWDEYLDACKKMTKVAADGTVEVYGGSDYHSIQYFLYPYVQQTGGDMYYSVDGKTSSYDDPRSVKGFERELQAELVDKIWFPKAVYRADNQQAQMTFCHGDSFPPHPVRPRLHRLRLARHRPQAHHAGRDRAGRSLLTEVSRVSPRKPSTIDYSSFRHFLFLQNIILPQSSFSAYFRMFS